MHAKTVIPQPIPPEFSVTDNNMAPALGAARSTREILWEFIHAANQYPKQRIISLTMSKGEDASARAPLVEALSSGCSRCVQCYSIAWLLNPSPQEHPLRWGQLVTSTTLCESQRDGNQTRSR